MIKTVAVQTVRRRNRVAARTKTSVRSKGQVEADVVMMSVMPYYTNRTCTEGVRSGGRRVKNEECEGRDYDVNEAFVMV